MGVELILVAILLIALPIYSFFLYRYKKANGIVVDFSLNPRRYIDAIQTRQPNQTTETESNDGVRVLPQPHPSRLITLPITTNATNNTTTTNNNTTTTISRPVVPLNSYTASPTRPVTAKQAALNAAYDSIKSAPTVYGVSDIVIPADDLKRWEWLVNLGLQKAPHKVIIGATGDGKTTTAMAYIKCFLLRHPKGRVILVDPHLEAGKWGNLVVHGGAENFTEIEAVIETIIKEYQFRLEQMRDGLTREACFDEILIVVDELPMVVMDCAKAPEMMKRLARGGRKVNMHLCLLTHSLRVKTLGIEGEGDLLANFARITLNSAAISGYTEKKYPGLLKDKEYVLPYVIERKGMVMSGDANGWIAALAQLPMPPHNQSSVLSQQPLIPVNNNNALTPTPIIPTLTPSVLPFDYGSPSPSPSPNFSGSGSGLDVQADTTREREKEDAKRDDAIKLLLSQGWSSNQIYTQLGGDRNKLLQRIKKLNGQQQ